MRWDDLPQKYKDLEKNFKPECYKGRFKESNDIESKFKWGYTPQGYLFWEDCHIAKNIQELPSIVITDYPESVKTKRYFIVFWTGKGITGHVDYTTDGTYIPLSFFQEHNPNRIITNIIELTESDYKDWKS